MFSSLERNVKAYQDLRQTSAQLFSLDTMPKKWTVLQSFSGFDLKERKVLTGWSDSRGSVRVKNNLQNMKLTPVVAHDFP